jgi:CRISP-associated protein Cas1
MQIFLDSFGALLCVKNQVFCVKPKDKPERSFAPTQVNAFFITKGIMVSADAMFLALQHDIPIVLLNSVGHPVGQVWSGKYGSISTIRKQQTLWALHENSLTWLCQTLTTKIRRQAEHLLALRESVKQNDTFRMAATRAAPVFERQISTLTDFKAYHLQSRADDLAQLRGIEGTASAVYFRAIAQALPKPFYFSERNRNPATDPFNATLNYTYGILYAMVELALIKAGLDPAIAVMHADRHNHNTMVFDMIEPYRAWADAVVCHLFIVEKLTNEHFQTIDNKGIRLSSEARQMVVGAFLQYLAETTLYTDGQMRKRSSQIDFDALRLATFLKISNYS